MDEIKEVLNELYKIQKIESDSQELLDFAIINSNLIEPDKKEYYTHVLKATKLHGNFIDRIERLQKSVIDILDKNISIQKRLN